MNSWLNQLPILSIAIPMFAGAAMVLLKEKRRRLVASIGIFSALLQFGVAITLLLARA